jgi:hypothetical protein
MGNAPSTAVLQAVHNGDVQAVRIAIQEHPTQIDDTEPTVGVYDCSGMCSCCCCGATLLLLLLLLLLQRSAVLLFYLRMHA